jgi:hydroxypyruvate isomerase
LAELFKRTKHAKYTYLFNIEYLENKCSSNGTAVLQKALDTFTYFLCRTKDPKKLLQQLGKTNVAVSGDTRFDRVAILDKDST